MRIIYQQFHSLSWQRQAFPQKTVNDCGVGVGGEGVCVKKGVHVTILRFILVEGAVRGSWGGGRGGGGGGRGGKQVCT